MADRDDAVIRRISRRRLLQIGALGAAGCGLSLLRGLAAEADALELQTFPRVVRQ